MENANYSEDMPLRGRILEKAITATVKDRQASYGQPFVQLSMAGDLKQIYRDYSTGKYCKAHDEAIEMLLTKIARIACGQPGHMDNYIDGAAYFAIAAECQNEHDRECAAAQISKKECGNVG